MLPVLSRMACLRLSGNSQTTDSPVAPGHAGFQHRSIPRPSACAGNPRKSGLRTGLNGRLFRPPAPPLVALAILWAVAFVSASICDAQDNSAAAAATVAAPLAAAPLTAAPQAASVPPAPVPDSSTSGPGLYAIFEPSMGRIVVRLLEDKAPGTVRNFVALATGVKPSADSDGTHMVKKRFYDGMIFHRVIRGFMIQTGDVNGTGDSNCGVDPIPDEIDPDLKFDVPGRVAMANIGHPDTAACQIFITVAPASHLNGTFTIFGMVSSGQDVADSISTVPVENDRPIAPVTLNKVTIERRDR